MDSVRRIRLAVRYDGTDFAGSQVQPARMNRAGELQAPARTVSGTLTTELEAILGQPIKLLWASRTDSGVHSEGNVCAFDVGPLTLPLERIAPVLSDRLPRDLRVGEAQECPPEWHPRYTAMGREYLYRVWLWGEPPVDKWRYVATCSEGWDGAAVAEVRRALCGRHDFQAFAKHAAELDSTICDLSAFDEETAGNEIRWQLRGNRFLRQMVCNLAGTLILVATGRVQPDAVIDALKGPASFKIKPAPARGLVLTKVIYPSE